MSNPITIKNFVTKVTNLLIREDVLSMRNPETPMGQLLYAFVLKQVGSRVDGVPFKEIYAGFRTQTSYPVTDFIEHNRYRKQKRQACFVSKPTLVACAELCALSFSLEGIETINPYPLTLPGSFNVSALQDRVLTVLKYGKYYRPMPKFWERAEMFFLVLKKHLTTEQIPDLYSTLHRIVERGAHNGSHLRYINEEMDKFVYPLYPCGFFSPVARSAEPDKIEAAVRHFSQVATQVSNCDGRMNLFGNVRLTKSEMNALLNAATMIAISKRNSPPRKIYVTNYTENLSTIGSVFLSSNLVLHVFYESSKGMKPPNNGIKFVQELPKSTVNILLFDFKNSSFSSAFKKNDKHRRVCYNN